MAECKECLYYEVCADFRRNICKTDQKRFEEYKINSNGICERFDRKSDFQKVVKCKDCILHEEGCQLDTHPYMTADDGYCYLGKRTPRKEG